MKAVVQRRYGSAVLGDLDVPVPGQGEVLLEVRAAGVDMGTWHLLSGKPYLVRVNGFGFRGPKSPVPGRDVSGVVTATEPIIAERARWSWRRRTSMTSPATRRSWPRT